MRTWFAAILVLLLGSCTREPSGRAPSYSVRDSVGIEIVESRYPLWDSVGTPWRVADAPDVSIGVADGEEPYQLFQVNSARRLTDGRIAVGNTGSGEIRFYTAAGEYAFVIGGHGGGPGEFSRMSPVLLWQGPSGVIVATDQGNGRVNVFEADGELRGSVSLELPAATPFVWLSGMFADGSWLAQGAMYGGAVRRNPGDIYAYDMIFLRYSRHGDLMTELLRTKGRPHQVFRSSAGQTSPYIPFAPGTMVAAGGDHVLVMGEANPEIQVRALGGTVVRLIRWTPAKRLLVEDVWSDYKRESLRTIADDRLRKLYADYFSSEIPLPELVPLADRLGFDSEHNLWVGRFRTTEAEPRTWDVFDAGGVWLGPVETPPNTTVLQIGNDFILLNHRDDAGVERVVLFKLLKGAAREAVDRTSRVTAP